MPLIRNGQPQSRRLARQRQAWQGDKLTTWPQTVLSQLSTCCLPNTGQSINVLLEIKKCMKHVNHKKLYWIISKIDTTISLLWRCNIIQCTREVVNQTLQSAADEVSLLSYKRSDNMKSWNLCRYYQYIIKIVNKNQSFFYGLFDNKIIDCGYSKSNKYWIIKFLKVNFVFSNFVYLSICIILQLDLTACLEFFGFWQRANPHFKIALIKMCAPTTVFFYTWST